MDEYGRLDDEVLYAIALIEDYEKVIRYALRIGFHKDDEIIALASKKQMYWWDKIERESDNKLLVKMWKSGEVHVYDRKRHLSGKLAIHYSGRRTHITGHERCDKGES